MSLREKAKRLAADTAERASKTSQNARESAQQAGVDEEVVQRAKARAAAAARRASRTRKPAGETTPNVSSGRSRNQDVFARAQDYATASAPVDVDMDPSPSGDKMWEFARAGNDGQPTAPTSNGENDDEDTFVEATWNDNPGDLDTPQEVRESIRERGHDPMDVETKSEAEFGHYLVHSLVDDPDHGGRTPTQLEAEHDMVVDALEEYGVDHDTPLEFEDPFGVTADGGGESGGNGWFDGGGDAWP